MIMNIINKFIQIMGAGTAKPTNQQLASHQPPLNQYRIAYSGQQFYIWYNDLLRKSLIQFTYSSDHLNQQYIATVLQSYQWRHNHKLLVSTLYIKQNTPDSLSLYYERILTNLSRIKDLCLEDSLEFYYVALKGFSLLYKKFGYFQVQQEMFHVNEAGKPKVWCDSDVSRIYPGMLGQGTQHMMINKIVHIIKSNSDPSNYMANMQSLMKRQNNLTFQKAINLFLMFCKHHQIHLKGQLKCIHVIYSNGLQNILDEYGPKQHNTQYMNSVNVNKSVPKINYSQSNHKNMIHSSIPFSQVGSPPRIKQPNVILNYSRLRNHESSSVINLSKKVDRGYSHDKQRRIKTIKSTNTHQLIPKLMCKPASQINHNYNAQSLKSRSIEIKRNKSVPILHQNPSMVKLENKYFQTRGTIDNSHNRDIKKRDTKVNIHYNIHASIDTKLEPKVQPKFKSKFDPQAHNAAQSKQELRLSPKIYNKAENRLKFVTNGFQEPKNKWEHACRSREIKISGKQSNQELSLQNKYGKQVINRGQLPKMQQPNTAKQNSKDDQDVLANFSSVTPYIINQQHNQKGGVQSQIVGSIVGHIPNYPFKCILDTGCQNPNNAYVYNNINIPGWTHKMQNRKSSKQEIRVTQTKKDRQTNETNRDEAVGDLKLKQQKLQCKIKQLMELFRRQKLKLSQTNNPVAPAYSKQYDADALNPFQAIDTQIKVKQANQQNKGVYIDSDTKESAKQGVASNQGLIHSHKLFNKYSQVWKSRLQKLKKESVGRQAVPTKQRQVQSRLIDNTIRQIKDNEANAGLNFMVMPTNYPMGTLNYNYNLGQTKLSQSQHQEYTDYNNHKIEQVHMLRADNITCLSTPGNYVHVSHYAGADQETSRYEIQGQNKEQKYEAIIKIHRSQKPVYEPKIDKDIWSDMLNVRHKNSKQI